MIDDDFPQSREAALAELVSDLALDQVAESRFVAPPRHQGLKMVYGGQLLAQALAASAATVADSHRIHALLGFFVRGGDQSQPLTIDVARELDGRRLAMRRVTATQGEKVVFSAGLSFQAVGEAPEFQHAVMPHVPGPEGLEAQLDLFRAALPDAPDYGPAYLRTHLPFDFRPVYPLDPFEFSPVPPVQYFWARAAAPLPDDMALHRKLLAWLSDLYLVFTGMLPFGVGMIHPRVHGFSVSHGLWFHHPARVDEWLLVAMDSPVSTGGRPMTRSSIFTRDGRLVATVAQDGIIRVDD